MYKTVFCAETALILNWQEMIFSFNIKCIQLDLNS